MKNGKITDTITRDAEPDLPGCKEIDHPISVRVFEYPGEEPIYVMDSADACVQYGDIWMTFHGGCVNIRSILPASRDRRVRSAMGPNNLPPGCFGVSMADANSGTDNAVKGELK